MDPWRSKQHLQTSSWAEWVHFFTFSISPSISPWICCVYFAICQKERAGIVFKDAGRVRRPSSSLSGWRENFAVLPITFVAVWFATSQSDLWCSEAAVSGWESWCCMNGSWVINRLCSSARTSGGSVPEATYLTVRSRFFLSEVMLLLLPDRGADPTPAGAPAGIVSGAGLQYSVGGPAWAQTAEQLLLSSSLWYSVDPVRPVAQPDSQRKPSIRVSVPSENSPHGPNSTKFAESFWQNKHEEKVGCFDQGDQGKGRSTYLHHLPKLALSRASLFLYVEIPAETWSSVPAWLLKVGILTAWTLSQPGNPFCWWLLQKGPREAPRTPLNAFVFFAEWEPSGSASAASSIPACWSPNTSPRTPAPSTWWWRTSSTEWCGSGRRRAGGWWSTTWPGSSTSLPLKVSTPENFGL